MSKKGRQVFQEKNRVVTPSVAASGVTHPSDATGPGTNFTYWKTHPPNWICERISKGNGWNGRGRSAWE